MGNIKPQPAFPTIEEDNYHGVRVFNTTEGMNLRDYFAAKAMQAIISNPKDNDDTEDLSLLWVSKKSYEIADEMLKEREIKS